jgi:AhpD family alkylhydroperoxidase
MNQRVQINKVLPEAYQLLVAFEKYMARTPLTAIRKEMIKIRASQINGCAFCLNMHTKDARKAGETEQRIYTLSAWRDTPYFTEEERAILALTEEVTLISNHHVSDETYQAVAAHFSEEQVAQIIIAIIAINSWNRLAITTGMMPA